MFDLQYFILLLLSFIYTKWELWDEWGEEDSRVCNIIRTYLRNIYILMFLSIKEEMETNVNQDVENGVDIYLLILILNLSIETKALMKNHRSWNFKQTWNRKFNSKPQFIVK